VEGPCEHGDETSGCIKCSEILEQLRNWLSFMELVRRHSGL
jgi:hypothetical protein